MKMVLSAVSEMTLPMPTSFGYIPARMTKPMPEGFGGAVEHVLRRGMGGKGREPLLLLQLELRSLRHGRTHLASVRSRPPLDHRPHLRPLWYSG